MRLLLLLPLLIGLTGCAQRYLRITAAPLLSCPQGDLHIRQRANARTWYVVSGCGRAVHCQQLVWAGMDEWTCQDVDPDSTDD
jgi:hypothetical protein